MLLPLRNNLSLRYLQKQEVWRNSSLEKYIVNSDDNIVSCLKKINSNKHDFLIVISDAGIYRGAIDEKILRNVIIETGRVDIPVREIPFKEVGAIHRDDSFETVIDIFQSENPEFVPVLSDDGFLINAVTKLQYHLILLEELEWDYTFDSFSLDESKLLHDVSTRPWGFYKSLFISDFAQTKIISLRPGQEISLQKHFRREEHWTIVRGKGIMTIDDQSFFVEKGRQIFIPKEAVHRIRNSQTEENLILVEVQLGDYFGEDDIVRLRDKYGRS
ncbi:MAG: cupin domain-containing protein [Deltaproteobacteria bacterium]|nr:cupin domain-containing protein [Deltaproteobacteria bacterium]